MRDNLKLFYEYMCISAEFFYPNGGSFSGNILDAFNAMSIFSWLKVEEKIEWLLEK